MDEGVDQVQACGLCEMLCESTEIRAHECLQGYRGYHIDPHTLNFYPVLDDGKTIVRKSLCDNREVNVSEQISTPNKNISKSKPSKKSNGKQKNKENEPNVTFTHQDEEILISEVANHTCIWNFSIPLQERNLKKRNEAWDTISQVFQNKFSATQLKQKWKPLHDIYRKIVTNNKLPSGSARKNSCKWSHFESLSFLQDSRFQIDTASNVDASESSSTIDDDSVDEENFARPSHPPGRSKRRCNTEETSALTKIADAIAHQSNITNPPLAPIFPPQPIADDITGFLSMLGAHLRSLPRVLQLQKMKEISDDIFLTVMDAQIAQNDTN